MRGERCFLKFIECICVYYFYYSFILIPYSFSSIRFHPFDNGVSSFCVVSPSIFLVNNIYQK